MNEPVQGDKLRVDLRLHPKSFTSLERFFWIVDQKEFFIQTLHRFTVTKSNHFAIIKGLEYKEYKYLGSWITDNAKCEEEVNRRIGKAKADFWKFKEFLRRDINLKLKLRILKMYIFSVVA